MPPQSSRRHWLRRGLLGGYQASDRHILAGPVSRKETPFGFKHSLYSSRAKKSSVHYQNVRDFAADGEIIIACGALNDETRYVVNMEVMTALRRGGVTINVVMVLLLMRKKWFSWHGGAGLDVFDDEPNVPKELFELDNECLISPVKMAEVHLKIQRGKNLITV